MALQPFVGHWPLLQFRNLFYTDSRTPWTRDQPVVRPLPTHRTTQTQNKRTKRHQCLEWESNPRSQCSSERAKRVNNCYTSFYFYERQILADSRLRSPDISPQVYFHQECVGKPSSLHELQYDYQNGLCVTAV
jgi:hypothetical protein